MLCHATLLRVGDVPLQGINCMRSWFLTVHRCFSSICRRKGKAPAASRKLDSAISPQKIFLQGVLPCLVRRSRGLRLETAAWSLILPRVPFQARATNHHRLLLWLPLGRQLGEEEERFTTSPQEWDAIPKGQAKANANRYGALECTTLPSHRYRRRAFPGCGWKQRAVPRRVW